MCISTKIEEAINEDKVDNIFFLSASFEIEKTIETKLTKNSMVVTNVQNQKAKNKFKRRNPLSQVKIKNLT